MRLASFPKNRPAWLRRPKGLNRRNIGVGLTAVVVPAISGGLIYLGYQKDFSPFSGFGPGEVKTTSEKADSQGRVIERTTITSTQEAKTLWDWANLAGVVAVPLLLAWFGFRLQDQQQKQNEAQKQRELKQAEDLATFQREQTERLVEVDRDIAEQNRQEEALQNYYDKVSALLVDKNLLAIAARGDTAKPEERELLGVSIDVIRARTLATLQRLDGSRKGSLIQFLIEAEVISKLHLSLAKADLSHADLESADLRDADLTNADLTGANLTKANLIRANLEGANLREANLEDANLVSARLEEAKLKEAELLGANLKDADLTRAVLTDAYLSCDLSDATLNDANLTNAEMEGACLRGVFLKNAILVDTILTGADLSFADLSSAYMTRADLTKADLTGADLKRAFLMNTILSDTILSDVEGLTKEQLEGKDPPYLCRTQLPEGIDIDPDRDCERLKEDLF